MKALATEKRAQILSLLCEGMSVRATSRITGSATNSILALIEKAGEACSAYQDENLRELPCNNIQLDELFSFIGCREKNKREDTTHHGDVWTWVALCSTTKLRITWHVGDRSHVSANAFCHDLAKRIPADAQITSDGLASYRWAVGSSMPQANFAQLVKVYEKDSEGREYVKRADKMPVFGNPDLAFISTSHIEASNLHHRMTNRRYARLSNAHSKKVANHCHMLAIGFMAYNFARKAHDAQENASAGRRRHGSAMDDGEDIIRMMDAHHEAKLAAEFQCAFAERFTPGRSTPKSYQPTPKANISLPWYLDMTREKPPQDELP